MLDRLFQSYQSSSRIQSDGAFILERSKRSLVPCLFHSEKVEETTNNLDPCQFFLCAMLGTEQNSIHQTNKWFLFQQQYLVCRASRPMHADTARYFSEQGGADNALELPAVSRHDTTRSPWNLVPFRGLWTVTINFVNLIPSLSLSPPPPPPSGLRSVPFRCVAFRVLWKCMRATKPTRCNVGGDQDRSSLLRCNDGNQ